MGTTCTIGAGVGTIMGAICGVTCCRVSGAAARHEETQPQADCMSQDQLTCWPDGQGLPEGDGAGHARFCAHDEIQISLPFPSTVHVSLPLIQLPEQAREETAHAVLDCDGCAGNA